MGLDDCKSIPKSDKRNRDPEPDNKPRSKRSTVLKRRSANTYHAKIFAGHGPKFYFGIQTSANINTNPRTENGCITIGRENIRILF